MYVIIIFIQIPLFLLDTLPCVPTAYYFSTHTFNTMDTYFTTLKTYLPWIVGALLILMIFGRDLFGWQTVFLLDYVPTPIRTRDWSRYVTIPWIWVVHDGLSVLLWYVFWSKVYLLTIVILTLILWYRWGSLIRTWTKSDHSFLPELGMVLMIYNPVFSSRMGTQPWVWLGIVLLWFGLYHLIKHRDRINIRDSLTVWAYRGIAMMSMNHASFMIAWLLLVLIIVRHQWKILWSAAIIATIVWLLNLNRILAGVLWVTTTVEQANTFSQANITEFMTRDHSWLGPVVTSMLWYGFWGEKTWSAYAPTRANPRRWIAGLVLLIIAWYGLTRRYRHDRCQTWFFFTVIVISLILGIGIASQVLEPSVQRLYDHVPWYRGLREPHKWVWLYMMCIIPLMLYGVSQGHKLIKQYITPWQLALLIWVIAIARVPGVMNQMMLRYDTTDYPKTYAQARDFLSTSTWSWQWLQLPWHSYHRCQWTNKVISNTFTPYMYPVPVIVSDNIEIWQLYTNSSNERSRVIEWYLQSHDVADLSGYNIQGIIYLTQCADFNNYKRIETDPNLTLIKDLGDVKIFKFK